MKAAMKFAMKISRRLRVKSTIISPNRSLLTLLLVGGISEFRLPTTDCHYHVKNIGEEKDSSPKKNWMACLIDLYPCSGLFNFTHTSPKMIGIGWHIFPSQWVCQVIICALFFTRNDAF